MDAGTVYEPETCIRFVNANSNAELPDGKSWETAFTRVQEAIDAAILLNSDTCPEGSEIWVAAGTYTIYNSGDAAEPRRNTVHLKNGITLLGGFSGDETDARYWNWTENETILDGRDIADAENRVYHVTTCTVQTGCGPNAVLDGFTIIGGDAEGDTDNTPNGGGLYVLDTSPKIYNCEFRENNADKGGAIYFLNSESIIENCRFSQNTSSDFGGAVYHLESSTSMVNCTFDSNESKTSGGAILNYESPVSITHCTFHGNIASIGAGAIYNDVSSNSSIVYSVFTNNSAKYGTIYNNTGSSPDITNCTFYHNSSLKYANTLHNNNSNPTITNCIIWGNIGVPTSIFNDEDSTPKINYNIIENGYPTGQGNRDVNPLFENPTGSQPRLSACSPAIDAGYDAASASVDIDGHEIVDNPNVLNCATKGNPDCEWVTDMGAYEYVSTESCDCTTRVTLSDITTVADGTSWATAFHNIQQAVDAASFASQRICPSGVQVWVATGTYHIHGSSGDDDPADDTINLKDNVALLGGFDGTETAESERAWRENPTILSGRDEILTNKVYHVVTCTRENGCGDDALLDGFQIKNGDAISDIPFQLGGGIYINDASPSITNTIFSENSALHGGAIFFEASEARVSNCQFHENKSKERAGAIYNISASPIIENCIFDHNEAGHVEETTAAGAAIYNDYGSSPEITNSIFTRNETRYGTIYNNHESSPRITHCTFFANSSAVDQSTMHNNADSNAIITNSIFWGDSSEYPTIRSNNSEVTVQYCILEDGYQGTGIGNLARDPLFVETTYPFDLRLSAFSPAIDAGMDTVDVPLDIDGNFRVENTDIPNCADETVGDPACDWFSDIGAYEFVDN